MRDPPTSGSGTPLRVYRVLDTDARRWWYHRRLRDDGSTAEARRRERASIREQVRRLRTTLANGGYLHVGRGGWSLHVSDASRLEGHGGIGDAIPQACLLVGIPVLDTTTVPDENLLPLLRLPMIGIQRCDPEPWSSTSFAPFARVVPRYVALGATLHLPPGHPLAADTVPEASS